MGKEAVYRRLRGEVAFTFDEIAMISCKLGISIDQIIGNHQSNRVTFDLNLLHSPDPLESYYEIIERYLRIFNYVKDDISTKIYTASNVIPFTLYSSYGTNTYQSFACADGFIKMGKYVPQTAYRECTYRTKRFMPINC